MINEEESKDSRKPCSGKLSNIEYGYVHTHGIKITLWRIMSTELNPKKHSFICKGNYLLFSSNQVTVGDVHKWL